MRTWRCVVWTLHNVAAKDNSPCYSGPCYNGVACLKNTTDPDGYTCLCTGEYEGKTCNSEYFMSQTKIQSLQLDNNRIYVTAFQQQQQWQWSPASYGTRWLNENLLLQVLLRFHQFYIPPTIIAGRSSVYHRNHLVGMIKFVTCSAYVFNRSVVPTHSSGIETSSYYIEISVAVQLVVGCCCQAQVGNTWSHLRVGALCVRTLHQKHIKSCCVHVRLCTRFHRPILWKWFVYLTCAAII